MEKKTHRELTRKQLRTAINYQQELAFKQEDLEEEMELLAQEQVNVGNVIEGYRQLLYATEEEPIELEEEPVAYGTVKEI